MSDLDPVLKKNRIRNFFQGRIIPKQTRSPLGTQENTKTMFNFPYYFIFFLGISSVAELVLF